MKFKFRHLCAALAGAMLLTTFSGCGAGTADDGDVVRQLKKEYSSLVKLGDYKGITYVAADTTVTDEDVQNELDSLVHQNSTKEEIKTGTATWGDAVNIDYVGYMDGEAFDGGNTQGAGTVITLGSSGYIDNFDEQIVGHKPGDTFDVNVTFPEDYGAADLAGKPARFETTLNFIQGEDIIPTVNDEFIKTATQDAYSSVDEYMQATREKLQQQADESAVDSDKHSVLQAVIDQTTIIEYPEQELQDRIDQVTAMYEDYAASNGVDLETLLSYSFGYDAESFQSFLKESIEAYIREKMVVVAIANAEGISASDEEKDAKIKDLLEQTGITDVSELNAQYGYEEEDYYMLVLEEKVVDFLYENATPTSSPTDASSEEATEAATEAVTETTTEAAE